MSLENHILELIRKVSSDLQPDVVRSIKAGQRKEKKGSMAYSALGQILENIELSREKSLPVCQDTGTNIYYVNYPRAMKEDDIRRAIVSATKKACKKNYLRPNAVDSITGSNTGDNVGDGQPYIHCHQWSKDYLEVNLLLKGGGSENVSAQYSLPNKDLGAGRDLAGVKKCVIDAIWKAQGKGCAPGVIGVGVGGDRGSSYYIAKEQLFRPLGDKNKDRDLAKVEKELVDKANKLGIGPMGFGGETTVLGVKIGSLHRVPASFFVSIAYLCWAARKGKMTIKNRKVSYA